MAAQRDRFSTLDSKSIKEYKACAARGSEAYTLCADELHPEFAKSLPSTRRDYLDPEKPSCGHDLKQQSLRASTKKWMALITIFLILFGIVSSLPSLATFSFPNEVRDRWVASSAAP